MLSAKEAYCCYTEIWRCKGPGLVREENVLFYSFSPSLICSLSTGVAAVTLQGGLLVLLSLSTAGGPCCFLFCTTWSSTRPWHPFLCPVVCAERITNVYVHVSAARPLREGSFWNSCLLLAHLSSLFMPNFIYYLLGIVSDSLPLPWPFNPVFCWSKTEAVAVDCAHARALFDLGADRYSLLWMGLLWDKLTIQVRALIIRITLLIHFLWEVFPGV